MKSVLLIAFLFLGTSACLPPARNSRGGSANSDRNSESRAESLKLYPIQLGFEKACTDSGGVFDAAQKLCDCPVGMSFSGWKEKCLPIEFDPEFKTLVFTGYPGIPSVLWSHDIEDRISQAKAPTASYQIGSLGSSFNFTLLVGAEKPDVKTQRALRGMLSEGNFLLLPRAGFHSVDFVYSTQNVNHPETVFETPKTSVLNPLPSLSKGLDDEVVLDTEVLNKVIGLPFRPNHRNDRVAGDCERYCELSQDFRFKDRKTEATRLRVIAGGSLLKDWIKIWDDSSHTSVRAVAVFTPSGNFSHLYHFSQAVLNSANLSVSRSLSIYGSDFLPWVVASSLRQAIAQNALENLRSNWASPADAIEGPQVVVCESGFNEEFFMKVPSTRILHGPSSSSLFGWVEGSAHGAFYYSGVASRNEFGFPDVAGNLASHAQSVSYNLSDNHGKLPWIIPIGFEACLQAGSRWMGRVKDNSQARVVSLSATDNYDSPSCANSPFLKNIEAAKGEFLWVVASGNDHLNLDRDFNDACPATLQRDDVITVASAPSEGSYLDYFSNFGKETVDIAADGASSLKPDNRATSFAAPRVAAVAAEIHYRYPNISPSRIKKVLMLSVELSPFDPLPVRSGGMLSRDRALLLAEVWGKNPSLAPKEAFVGTFGNDSSTRHALWFFNQRGLFN